MTPETIDAKAHRLLSAGCVHVLFCTAGVVSARVRGDSGRCGTDDERLAWRMDIQPPRSDACRGKRLPDTVAGLDRRPAIASDALGYLALLRPQVFADALVHPTNRVSQVVVWLWVAEISQRR
jgi:hypothetical protein